MVNKYWEESAENHRTIDCRPWYPHCVKLWTNDHGSLAQRSDVTICPDQKNALCLSLSQSLHSFSVPHRARSTHWPSLAVQNNFLEDDDYTASSANPNYRSVLQPWLVPKAMGLSEPMEHREYLHTAARWQKRKQRYKKTHSWIMGSLVPPSTTPHPDDIWSQSLCLKNQQASYPSVSPTIIFLAVWGRTCLSVCLSSCHFLAVRWSRWMQQVRGMFIRYPAAWYDRAKGPLYFYFYFFLCC